MLGVGRSEFKEDFGMRGVRRSEWERNMEERRDVEEGG